MKSAMMLVLTSAALASVAGCSRENNTFRAFYSEAGSDIETGDFGRASVTNTQIQSGNTDYAINLTRKFGADVPPTVNFAFNSYVLDANAQAVLLRQADWIRQFPEVRFRVYGFTDLVGSNAYNKTLGMRRAQAVVAFLTRQGISRSRLEAVVSYGETQPLVFTQAPDRRNRRAVTEVSGFVKHSGLVLNGKYAQVIMREYVKSALPLPGQQPVTAGGTGSGT